MPDIASAGTPMPAAKPKRKSPVRIDWKEIARRLAEGARPAAVAAAAGIDEDRLWRHLRASLRFRFYLSQALERQQLLAELQLGVAGRSAALSRSLQPESLDGDLLKCLLAESGSGGIAKQVEQLGATGQRPPNMAFRRRLAAERRQMDAQFAAIEAECRAIAGQPARSLANASETPRSPANAGEASRSAAKAGEAPRSETKPAAAASVAPPLAPRPPRPPVEPPRAIVDIEGPDRARLGLRLPALPSEDG